MKIDVEEQDFYRLMSAVQYVIDKYKTEDVAMAEYLEEVLSEVKDHLGNQIQGAQIAQEIDAVLHFIGGSNGNDDEPGPAGSDPVGLPKRTRRHDGKGDRSTYDETVVEGRAVPKVRRAKAEQRQDMFRKAAGLHSGSGDDPER